MMFEILIFLLLILYKAPKNIRLKIERLTMARFLNFR